MLIAIHTAGVNSWDADMREGWWPDSRRPGFPLVPGTDGSGTIAAVGSRVRRFTRGERVYAYSFANPKGGFYAEYVAVAADKAGRLPADLSLVEAGAIPTTGLTALTCAAHFRELEREVADAPRGAVNPDRLAGPHMQDIVDTLARWPHFRCSRRYKRSAAKDLSQQLRRVPAGRAVAAIQVIGCTPYPNEAFVSNRPRKHRRDFVVGQNGRAHEE